MIKKTTSIIREFAEVSDYELKNALVDFCNRLHIHGSGEGYNLYEAVLMEKGKAVKENKTKKNINLSTLHE